MNEYAVENVARSLASLEQKASGENNNGYCDENWKKYIAQAEMAIKTIFYATAYVPTGTKAWWAGSDNILGRGWEVEVLAQDPEDIGVPATLPTWIRYWPSKNYSPSYRSCSASDLVFDLNDLD